MAARNNIQSEMLGLARGQAAKNAFRPGGSNKSSARKRVVNPFPSGPVGQERLPVRIETESPRIDKSFGIYVQLQCFRLQFPYAAAFQPPDAQWRFYMTVNIDGLVAIHSPFRATNNMMARVSRTTSTKQTP